MAAYTRRFVVDAEETGPDKSNVGDPYTFWSEQTANLTVDDLSVQPEFIEDNWGTWLTASAPSAIPLDEPWHLWLWISMPRRLGNA